MTQEELQAIREHVSFDDVSIHDVLPLLAEIERLTAKVEAKVAQNVALIGQNGRLQLEVERLTAERDTLRELADRAAAEQGLAQRRMEQAQQARDVALLRGYRRGVNAAADELDRLLTKKKATAIWVSPDELRAIPNPEDK